MRGMLERISPVLVAAVLAGGFVVSSALPAGGATDERRDRLHAVRPVAATTQTPMSVHPDLAVQIAEAEWFDRAAEAEFIAGVARAEAAAAAASRGGSSATISRAHGRCDGDVQCFLECTRAHESDTSGGYGAVSSSGTYRGAYQFQQSTWDAAVAGAGHGEFAGLPADQVPSEIQDAAAAHLYSVSGTRPWGGRC
ncbi:MAG: hypothetical protein FJW95_13875 [Actinobacteria bacterium]|nr:hypothetical protein [Actinomycetota bacterium]